MYVCVYVCVAVKVEGLLARFSSSLQHKGRYLEAVELYRVANKPQEAALLTCACVCCVCV